MQAAVTNWQVTAISRTKQRVFKSSALSSMLFCRMFRGCIHYSESDTNVQKNLKNMAEPQMPVGPCALHTLPLHNQSLRPADQFEVVPMQMRGRISRFYRWDGKLREAETWMTETMHGRRSAGELGTSPLYFLKLRGRFVLCPHTCWDRN